MREILSLIRASFRTALSYRLSMVLSLASLTFTVVPLFFVARALQPTMAKSISTEGGVYFAFLLVGMIAYTYISVAVNAIPAVVSSGVSTGTLEALLGTRAPLPSLLLGLIGYNFLWTTVRAVILLAAGLLFGVHLAWGQLWSSLLILVLIVLCYLPFGLIGAALVIAVRTNAAIPQVVLLASTVLGGVYFPTSVLPPAIAPIAEWLPLTPGLRALRQTLLLGYPIGSVSGDLMRAAGLALVATAIGALSLRWAFGYARRAGSLSQY